MSYVPKSEAELGVDISGKESESIFSRLMKYRLGIVPLPAFLIIATIVLLASQVEIMKEGKAVSALPADMLGGFAVIMVFG